jgi:hypothetical protein
MKQYPDKRKVYLRYFYKDGKKFIKVGITRYRDAEERVTANSKYDKRVTWLEYFDDSGIITSVVCPSEVHAEIVEESVLRTWGPKDVNFPVNFSGIQEFRYYSEQRATDAKKQIQLARNLNKTGWR